MIRTEDGLQIVGSSVVATAELLPLRLSPVFSRPGDHGYLLPSGAGDDHGDELIREDRDQLDVEFEEGSMMRFETPIPYQSGHVLVQIEADGPPEYFPATELAVRLEQAAERALHEAARRFEGRDIEGAAERAWYAGRALPEDATPLLLLLHLERSGLPEAALDLLLGELRDLGETACAEAWRRIKGDGVLKVFLEALKADPRARITEPPPAYLPPGPNKRGSLAGYRSRIQFEPVAFAP